MLSVATNINEVIAAELAKLSAFDAISVCKAQAIETVNMFRKRIHQEGKASDGSQIGEYSKGYLVLRSGAYKNSDTYSRGKNKGKRKDAGFYTKRVLYSNIGTHRVEKFEKLNDKKNKRTMYNRGSDPMVILSLTRQMENQLTVIPIPNGYGVGWHDSQNFQKAGWAEETYIKKIYSLMSEEHAKVIEMAEQAISEALK
jgi:hypothetical protein